jgi:predicted enzyme related to lactoylglutathione lyase
MFTGLKSVVYPSADLEANTKFWETMTGVKPYFAESYYVGFKVGEIELGLDPNAAKEGLTYPVSYWHVKEVKAAVSEIVAGSATINGEPRDVGGGMMMATFKDPSGNIFGIIDEPNT